MTFRESNRHSKNPEYKFQKERMTYLKTEIILSRFNDTLNRITETVKMTTTATIEFTEAEITHRKACAYLKGYIVAASVKRGMKWEGDKERTPEFALGYENGTKSLGFSAPRLLTYAHIIYNRLRHNKPHRTSGTMAGWDDGAESNGGFDQAYLRYVIAEFGYCNSSVHGSLVDLGIDINDLLNKEVA